MNPMDLRKGIKLATDHVVSVLSDISKPISTKEEVAQVGTISANRCAAADYDDFACEVLFLRAQCLARLCDSFPTRRKLSSGLGECLGFWCSSRGEKEVQSLCALLRSRNHRCDCTR